MSTVGVDRVAYCLAYVHDVLARHDIWHAITCGTLLGAVRDGDLIAWDHDFDLVARPSDRQRIVALNAAVEADGFAFKYAVLNAADLAVAPDGCERFNAGSLVVFHEGEAIGDIYTFWLFSDGVLRAYDLAQEIYWCPRNRFPHWFVEELGEATVRGRPYPALRAPERWLEATYGPDWRTPYRSTQKGGEPRAGMTALGDLAEPPHDALLAWCEAQGWDRSQYAECPTWPRTVRGAGPGGDGDGVGHGWTDLADLRRL